MITCSTTNPNHLHHHWRAAEHIFRCGPRVVFEILREISFKYGIPAEDLTQLLDRFQQLDPQIFVALGANRRVSSPLRIVARR